MSLKDELHLEKTKTKDLENQVSKLKRNLDLSNSQFTKTRKEKNDALKELTRKDTVQRLTHRMRVKFVFSPVPPSMGFLTFYLHKLLVFTLKLTSRGLIS